jgi:hypothetical protein
MRQATCGSEFCTICHTHVAWRVVGYFVAAVGISVGLWILIVWAFLALGGLSGG